MPYHIAKKSPTEYDLFCAVCDKLSARFLKGIDSIRKIPAVIYTGLCDMHTYPLEEAQTIFADLAAGNLVHLHAFILDKHGGNGINGIDAYCPECDALYCTDHYKRTVEFDDDQFYDDTYGICPQGHARILDD